MWLALWIFLGLALATVLAVAIVLATQVEDWSRDLSTNVAATSDEARDPRLRTLDSPLPPAELADAVAQAAGQLPRWELVERTEDDRQVRLHFVRTTGILRFKDDIRVRIEPAARGSRLSAESRSRVGKGDLGQNPRNLRELLDKLRDAAA